jgi:hypothetical protein
VDELPPVVSDPDSKLRQHSEYLVRSGQERLDVGGRCELQALTHEKAILNFIR